MKKEGLVLQRERKEGEREGWEEKGKRATEEKEKGRSETTPFPQKIRHVSLSKQKSDSTEGSLA